MAAAGKTDGHKAGAPIPGCPNYDDFRQMTNHLEAITDRVWYCVATTHEPDVTTKFWEFNWWQPTEL